MGRGRNGKRRGLGPLRREAGLALDEDQVRHSKARPGRRKGSVKERKEGTQGLVA